MQYAPDDDVPENAAAKYDAEFLHDRTEQDMNIDKMLVQRVTISRAGVVSMIEDELDDDDWRVIPVHKKVRGIVNSKGHKSDKGTPLVNATNLEETPVISDGKLTPGPPPVHNSGGGPRVSHATIVEGGGLPLLPPNKTNTTRPLMTPAQVEKENKKKALLKQELAIGKMVHMMSTYSAEGAKANEAGALLRHEALKLKSSILPPGGPHGLKHNINPATAAAMANGDPTASKGGSW